MKPIFILTALLLVRLSVLHAQDTTSSPSGPPSGTKWKLVFSDEFDGTAIDETKWKPSDYRKWEHPGFKTRLAKENCALDGPGDPAKDEVRR
jgi:beta-glucanase (GH16 family)